MRDLPVRPVLRMTARQIIALRVCRREEWEACVRRGERCGVSDRTWSRWLAEHACGNAVVPQCLAVEAMKAQVVSIDKVRA